MFRIVLQKVGQTNSSEKVYYNISFWHWQGRRSGIRRLAKSAFQGAAILKTITFFVCQNNSFCACQKQLYFLSAKNSYILSQEQSSFCLRKTKLVFVFISTTHLFKSVSYEKLIYKRNMNKETKDWGFIGVHRL